MDKSDYYHSLHEGAKIDWFEIRSVLGSGGFGITYLAWDERLQCQVAIKEYLPSDMAIRKADGTSIIAKSNADKENFEYGLKSFLEEARTLARFNEPNIIRVRSFLEANGTAYMVMDYEEGESLDVLLKREGTLNETSIKEIIIPILDGLRAVHKAEFLHRDIKPGNIYLRKDGPPVLIDFGAARQALGEHSRSMTGIVTAGYAPFEQYSNRGKQGPWTDLYAIGATIYRCICGHAPVEASERIAAMGEDEPDPLIPATELSEGKYSKAFLEAIDWMLQPAAKNRPHDVTSVLDRLLGKSSQTQKSQSRTSRDTSIKSEEAVSSSAPLEGKRAGLGVIAGLVAFFFTVIALAALIIWLLPEYERLPEKENIELPFPEQRETSPAGDDEVPGEMVSLPGDEEVAEEIPPSVIESNPLLVIHQVRAGDTLREILNKFGIDQTLYQRFILLDNKSKKRLARLRPGQNLHFQFSKENELVEIIHNIDSMHSTSYLISDDDIRVNKHEKKVQVKIETAHGAIESSLFNDGIRAGMTEKVIIGMAKLFSWDIDFGRELQKGDYFGVIFEARYVDGQRIGTGNILAAEYINGKKKHRVIRYVDSRGKIDYLDPQGRSRRQQFISAPIAEALSGKNMRKFRAYAGPLLETLDRLKDETLQKAR